MKKVQFEYYRGHNDIEKVVVEFDDNVTDNIIEDEFQCWVWETIGDDFGWKELTE